MARPSTLTISVMFPLISLRADIRDPRGSAKYRPRHRFRYRSSVYISTTTEITEVPDVSTIDELSRVFNFDCRQAIRH